MWTSRRKGRCCGLASAAALPLRHHAPIHTSTPSAQCSPCAGTVPLPSAPFAKPAVRCARCVFGPAPQSAQLRCAIDGITPSTSAPARFPVKSKRRHALPGHERTRRPASKRDLRASGRLGAGHAQAGTELLRLPAAAVSSCREGGGQPCLRRRERDFHTRALPAEGVAHRHGHGSCKRHAHRPLRCTASPRASLSPHLRSRSHPSQLPCTMQTMRAPVSGRVAAARPRVSSRRYGSWPLAQGSLKLWAGLIAWPGPSRRTVSVRAKYGENSRYFDLQASQHAGNAQDGVVLDAARPRGAVCSRKQSPQPQPTKIRG
jgi:hypothetical protein